MNFDKTLYIIGKDVCLRNNEFLKSECDVPQRTRLWQVKEMGSEVLQQFRLIKIFQYREQWLKQQGLYLL